MDTIKKYGVRCELFVDKLRFIATLQPREKYLHKMMQEIAFQDACTSMDAVIEQYEDENGHII